MKIFSAISLLLLFASNAIAADDDQSNMQFADGSVIIHCAAPAKEQQISTEVFNEAFPHWIKQLQQRANEGKIARAHYLSELKKGILIVVLGEDSEAAMSQALEIQAENQAIMKAALAKSGMDENSFDAEKGCQLIEIGPVAILPQK